MLEERTLLLVKKESTYGSDPTPTVASNAVIVSGAKIKEVHEAAERPAQVSSLSPVASLAGSIYAELSFTVEVKGSGTKGTAGRIGAILQACGLDETASAGSSVTYTPASGTFASVTAYLYKDGRLHIVTGARGTLKYKGQANKTAVLEVSLKGLYTAPTDVALPAVTAGQLETTSPPVCKGQTVSLNSVTTLAIESSELDLGVNVAALPSKSATNGIGSVAITGRKPSLTLNPESVTIATLDLRSLIGSPVAYSEVLGSVAGNKVTVSVPKFNLIDIEYGEREGMVVENLKGECTRNTDAGNNELSFLFE